MNARFTALESRIDSKVNTLYTIAFGNVAATILTAVGIVVAVILTK
jgi:hypothetical protein